MTCHRKQGERSEGWLGRVKAAARFVSRASGNQTNCRYEYDDERKDSYNKKYISFSNGTHRVFTSFDCQSECLSKLIRIAAISCNKKGKLFELIMSSMSELIKEDFSISYIVSLAFQLENIQLQGLSLWSRSTKYVNVIAVIISIRKNSISSFAGNSIHKS